MNENKKHCLKCKQELTEDKSRFKCDGCNRFLHTQCANVTATEIKCLQLQTRKLKFFCEDCEEGLLQIPILKQMIETLQDEVEQLKNKRPNCLMENELIVNEVVERQKRARNLILYNLPEPKGSEAAQRKEEDKRQATNIFNKIVSAPPQVKNIIRLGKKTDKARPVKIILEDIEDVLEILKNKRNLKNSSVRISSDILLTPSQQELYRKVKEQLEERRAEGEQNIYIKYIRGVPRIIKANLD